MNIEDLVEKNKIVKMYAGSHAYGTAISTSDVDFRGIFCADPVNLLTPFFPVHEYQDNHEEDTKYYELSHFMKLCLGCNPNILELLWTGDADISFRSDAYNYLRDNRKQLLSSKVAFTFSGYAIAQLKRLKQSKKKVNYLPDLTILCDMLSKAIQDDLIDKKWICDQCGDNVLAYMKEDYASGMLKISQTQYDRLQKIMPTSLEKLFKKYNIQDTQKQRCRIVCKPLQKDFIHLVQWFGDEKILPSTFDIEKIRENHRFVKYSNDTYGIYSALGYTLYSKEGHLNANFDGERNDLPSPIAIVKFDKLEYSNNKDEYDKFWEWRKNRNKKRLKTEKEFSYDTKNAMHLVRLLRMGEEILTTGEVIVKRPDAAELLDIRAGSLSYEELLEYAEEKDNLIRGTLYKDTQLPKKPDIKQAARILMEVQELVWNSGR